MTADIIRSSCRRPLHTWAGREIWEILQERNRVVILAPAARHQQQREAIKRRDHGEATLAEIGRSYNVSGLTIARLI